MAGKKLTIKEQLFVDYYLSNGFNATQATISAGYSEKTARSIGYRLLTKVHIREAIMEQMTPYGVVTQKILQRVMDIALLDMSDFAEVSEGGEVISKPFDQLPEGATKLIKGIEEKQIIKESKDGQTLTKYNTLKYILCDPQKAHDQMIKILSLATDKIDITSGGKEIPKSVFVIHKGNNPD